MSNFTPERIAELRKGLKRTPDGTLSIRNHQSEGQEPESSLYLGDVEIAILFDVETGDLFDLLCELYNSEALTEIERLQSELVLANKFQHDVWLIARQQGFRTAIEAIRNVAKLYESDSRDFSQPKSAAEVLDMAEWEINKLLSTREQVCRTCGSPKCNDAGECASCSY